ncbi:TPA: hypothetical protein JAJ00_001502 [Clostridioides difficile]|nr:hypothetical protein [Clostridioides difficile]
MINEPKWYELLFPTDEEYEKEHKNCFMTKHLEGEEKKKRMGVLKLEEETCYKCKDFYEGTICGINVLDELIDKELINDIKKNCKYDEKLKEYKR